MGEGDRRGGNLIALVVSRAAQFAAGFAASVILARWLGREGFGAYTFVLMVVAVFAFGASFGIDLLLVREIARTPERLRGLLGSALATVAATSLLTGLVVVGYAWLRDGRPEVVLAAALGAAALAVTVQGQVLQSAFHGLRRMGLEVPGVLVGRLAYLVLLVGLLWLGLGVPGVFGAQLGAAVLTVVAFAWMLRRALQLIPAAPSRAQVGFLVREGWPFAGNLLFSAVYLSSDVLVLKEFWGDAELGLYRGAALLIIQLPILAQVLSRGVYPRMSRHLGSPDRIRAELSFISRVLLVVSVPIATGGMVVAEPLIVFLLGEEYAGGALALMIMLPLVPLRFVNNGFGMTLTSLNRQRDRTRVILLAAAFNLVSNLFVIPRWGVEGAAATTLATEVLNTAVLAALVRHHLDGPGLVGVLVRVAVPAGLMAGAVLALDGSHVLVRVAVGGVAYAVLSWLSRAWTTRDLRSLLAI